MGTLCSTSSGAYIVSHSATFFYRDGLFSIKRGYTAAKGWGLDVMLTPTQSEFYNQPKPGFVAAISGLHGPIKLWNIGLSHTIRMSDRPGVYFRDCFVLSDGTPTGGQPEERPYTMKTVEWREPTVR